MPGNHDNVFARLAFRRAGFFRHITPERHPYYEDDEIAVMGADTTRSFTIKDRGLRSVDVQYVSCTRHAVAEPVAKGADVFLTGHLHASL